MCFLHAFPTLASSCLSPLEIPCHHTILFLNSGESLWPVIPSCKHLSVAPFLFWLCCSPSPSFLSSPYTPLCLSLVFPLFIPCQPCTCHSAITLFLLLEGEDVPEMLALVLVFILLSAVNGEGCIMIWKDIQRNGWRLWQLQSFLWSMVWWSWTMQLAEGCGVRCTIFSMFRCKMNSDLFTLWHMWWKAEWTWLPHCKDSSLFL